MRVWRSLLATLTQNTPDARPELGDDQLFIPGTLQPTLALRDPIFTPTAAAGDAKISSFLESNRLGVAASTAAQTPSVATVRPGLWEFHIWLNSVFDFTQTINAPNQVQLRLIEPSLTNVFTHLSLPAIANVAQREQASLIVLLGGRPTDTWLWQLRVEATGAGQTGSLNWAVNGNRLL